jgi:hypothetical protein
MLKTETKLFSAKEQKKSTNLGDLVISCRGDLFGDTGIERTSLLLLLFCLAKKMLKQKLRFFAAKEQQKKQNKTSKSCE